MDKDRNSRKDRESLIEDKLKKILFGSKSSTVRDDKSSHSKELDSIPDNYFSKENDKQNPEENQIVENKEEPITEKEENNQENINLILTNNINLQVNNSQSFNDKFSFADKVTFESEKFRNDEIAAINFNQYIRTEPENDTINSDNICVYNKKILKNSNGIKKKESSFTSDKLINESLMSERTLQSNQYSVQDTIQTTNPSVPKNENENHYLHIIEYKLQLNKENNKFANFHSHNDIMEQNKNECEKNYLSQNPANNNSSFQNSTSINSSNLGSSINTKKKENLNTSKDKSKTNLSNNTISTSSTIPKRGNNQVSNNHSKLKISNKNFDSNKNDLNKFLSSNKKDDTKFRDVKNYINNKPKADTGKTNANISKEEIEANINKLIKSNTKSKDKKKSNNNKDDKSQEKLNISFDKTPMTKHVKTSSVCSVKNFKNNELLLKYEPLSQRSSSNTNTTIINTNSNSGNTTNIKKIKIDNININTNEDNKKFDSHISQMKNLNFYKEKYLKNREKVKKANELILKLKTQLKIEELKQKVKSEKVNINESFQQLFDKSKKDQGNYTNDITSEKMENFLNNMNIKHTETVSNLLNIFRSNRNFNDAFIGEVCNLMKNDRRYLTLFETFGKTINQLLLTNLNIRENDLKIIQNQQIIIDNYENNSNEANNINTNNLLSVSKDKDDYDTIQLTDLSSVID